jgi:hypothetical protein
VSVHELDLQFVDKQARLAVSVFYDAMAYVVSLVSMVVAQ